MLFCAAPVSAQPHANVPLPTPQFSIDRVSPSSSASLLASAVLVKPGPMVLHQGAGMGLTNSVEDEIDDFSYNRRPVAQPGQVFLLLFSVDRASVGARPPDPSLAVTGRRFNVFDQADRHQAPADLFLALDPFTTAGVVGPKNGIRGTAKNNAQAVNQGDTGGDDVDLSPAEAPVQRNAPGDSVDNVDGIGYPPTGSKDRNPAFFFTVSANSPSLASLPGSSGQQSGADVFVDLNQDLGGNEGLYVAAPSLGLLPTSNGDDIAALVVFDNGNNVFDPGVDQILFTLARGSPSLVSGNYSPADILVSYGNGVFSLFASADDLGLLPSDHVDALEIFPTTNPQATLFDYAIYLVWPGDHNRDGTLDQADCSAFAGCYSGPGVPYDTSPPVVHVVQVGPGPAFHPSVINIEAGDVVQWVWVDGPHNVVSGSGGVADGVFNSGSPGFPPRIFEVAFSAALLDLYPRSGWVYEYFSAPNYSMGMIGTVIVHSHPCAPFDVDFDGDVDCADWIGFQAVYLEATGGGACVRLGIPEFVAVLLGEPSPAGYRCLADMNGDGRVDGLDIQPYVNALLP
jgi:plastocyanin